MRQHFALTRAVVFTLLVGMFLGATFRAWIIGALEWLVPHASGLMLSSVLLVQSLRELFHQRRAA